MNFKNIKTGVIIFFIGLFFLMISENIFPILVGVIDADTTSQFVQNDWPFIRGVLWFIVWLIDALTVIILPMVFIYMGVTDDQPGDRPPGFNLQ